LAAVVLVDQCVEEELGFISVMYEVLHIVHVAVLPYERLLGQFQLDADDFFLVLVLEQVEPGLGDEDVLLVLVLVLEGV
jgi:hypothetical protein